MLAECRGRSVLRDLRGRKNARRSGAGRVHSASGAGRHPSANETDGGGTPRIHSWRGRDVQRPVHEGRNPRTGLRNSDLHDHTVWHIGHPDWIFRVLYGLRRLQNFRGDPAWFASAGSLWAGKHVRSGSEPDELAETDGDFHRGEPGYRRSRLEFGAASGVFPTSSGQLQLQQQRSRWCRRFDWSRLSVFARQHGLVFVQHGPILAADFDRHRRMAVFETLESTGLVRRDTTWRFIGVTVPAGACAAAFGELWAR